MLQIVASVCAAAAVILALLAWRSWRHDSQARSRRAFVARYATTSGGGMSRDSGNEELVPVRVADLMLRLLPRASRTDRLLDGAAVDMSPGAWLIVRLSLSFASAVLVWLLTSAPVVAAVAGLILGFGGTRSYLSRRQARLRREFEEGLPEFLLLVSSSLRSGLPFLQALESAARNGEGEIERQMRRAMSEIRLGVSTDDALMAVAERTKCHDMEWAASALALGRSIGGNLTHILDSVADTISRRADVQRQLRTLSAEGRMSAVVMVAMPIAIFLFMFFTQREYLERMWTTSAGVVMLIIAAVLIGVGWLWASALGKVRM